MDWFLYDIGLRHDRVKRIFKKLRKAKKKTSIAESIFSIYFTQRNHIMKPNSQVRKQLEFKNPKGKFLFHQTITCLK